MAPLTGLIVTHIFKICILLNTGNSCGCQCSQGSTRHCPINYLHDNYQQTEVQQKMRFLHDVEEATMSLVAHCMHFNQKSDIKIQLNPILHKIQQIFGINTTHMKLGHVLYEYVLAHWSSLNIWSRAPDHVTPYWSVPKLPDVHEHFNIHAPCYEKTFCFRVKGRCDCTENRHNLTNVWSIHTR